MPRRDTSVYGQADGFAWELNANDQVILEHPVRGQIHPRITGHQ